MTIERLRSVIDYLVAQRDDALRMVEFHGINEAYFKGEADAYADAIRHLDNLR